MHVIEIEAKGDKFIRVDGTDYQLAFPLPIVVELEAKIGRSMKTGGDWLRIQTKEVRDILFLGFKTHHKDAEEVADKIAARLEPEEIDNVINAICAATCPKALAKWQEELEKLRDRLKKGLTLPNVPGADAR